MLKVMANRSEYVERGFELSRSAIGNKYCMCPVCIKAKMRSKQSRSLIDKSRFDVGKMWYVDLSGDFIESLIRKNKYMVVFVDSRSRLIVVYFIKSKSGDEVLKILEKFINEFLVSPRFNKEKEFIFLQSDNGEFADEKIKLFSWKCGIMQRFSAPYHSVSNGPVERAILKVKEMGKAFLIEKLMPEEYWEFAASMAAYVLNRTPFKYKNKWQMDAVSQFFGVVADYSRFRIPFSVAYVLKTPSELKKDWNTRAHEGVLVGITDSTYSVYVPDTHTITESSNVLIDEHAKRDGSSTGLHGTSPHPPLKDAYELADFDYLIDTEHVDNENGLKYRVGAVRKKRLRQGDFVVVDRKLVGGSTEITDTIFALDAAVMTGPLPAHLLQTRLPIQPQARVCQTPARTSTTAPDQPVSDDNAVRPDTSTAPYQPPSCQRVNERKRPRRASPPPIYTPHDTRRSTRIASKSPINYYLTTHTLVETHQVDGEILSYYIPKRFAQAIACSDADHWIAAMDAELSGLREADCYIIELMPSGIVALPCKWVYDVKTDSLGRLIKYKARLVVGGHRQVEGVDFTDTFSPAVSWDSVRLFLALTVKLRLIPLQLDINMAYLYADIDEGLVIYMRPPPGMNLPEGYMLRLKKSLYGLKQAGRNWNRLIHSKLTEAGFVRIDEDACVYLRIIKGQYTLLLLYVDDIICSASSKDVLSDLVAYLRSLFKLKLMGVPTNVSMAPSQLLGIQLVWGEDFQSVQISAAKIVKELLSESWDEFGMGKVAHRTPMEPQLRLTESDQLKDPTDEEDIAMQSKYRHIVGVLIFLVTTCRVDLSFALCVLSRSMKNPGWAHYRAAQYVLSYLSNKTDLGIAYYHDGNRYPYAYADADFGSDESRRAYMGYMFILANGPIAWKCKMSEVIPLSSCESEILSVHAAFRACQQAVFLKKFLESIGVPTHEVQVCSTKKSQLLEPVIVYEDNKAAISWSQNPVSMTRMKHIDRDLKWIRQAVEDKTIVLEWIESKRQLADIFTKAVTAVVFEELVPRFMIAKETFLMRYSRR